ncbi:MAG: leucyl aminopeptidase [Gaiellales bacterium]
MAREPMEIAVTTAEAEAVEADVLAVAVPEPVRLTGTAARLDGLLGGRLARLVDDHEIRGTTGSVTVVHTHGELGAHRIALVGIGKEGSLDADSVRTAAARVAERTGTFGAGRIAWALGEPLPSTAAEQARALVDGTVLASFDPGCRKTGERERAAVTALLLAGPEAIETPARRQAVVSGWTNRARELVDAPANELSPAALAEQAAGIAAVLDGVRFEAMDGEEIRAAGMGALAAVAQGSSADARLIRLEYEPPGTSSDTVLCLVGKAITFDSGGLSLKPAARMDEMKGDMAGGAAAICGLAAIAELGLPLRVHAVVPACENMPGGGSFRPGDIVTALNGTTIEVTNTDAEGRLVLADALVEARRRGGTHLLDLATLTGGVTVALGDFYAGLMANDDQWRESVRTAAERSGDHAWPLPLHATYRRIYRSTIADVKNSSTWRQAVPLYAGMFLQEFAGDGPWAHLDIAGTAHLSRGRGDYYTKPGATGYGVRLIAALAEQLTGEA